LSVCGEAAHTQKKRFFHNFRIDIKNEEKKMQTIDPASTVMVLISAALVFINDARLAFFYGGLVRRKNVLTIMMQSFVSMGIVTAIWVFGGFSLAFGNHWAASSAFAILWIERRWVCSRSGGGVQQKIPFLAYFVFQEMFAVITRL